MLYRNKKKATIIASLAVIVLISLAAHSPEKQQGPRNLQVLSKNISHDSLDAIMDEFKEALGVKCNFCHAQSATNPGHLDFASDDKMEKGAARHMMKMTTEINSKYFNWNGSNAPDTIRAVTCITCHRGSEHPEASALTFEHHGPPPPPPAKN